MRSLAKQTSIALQTLGEMLRVGRAARGISQRDLAQRLNVSRYTVMAMEKGSPAVAIGTVFEAAMIVGIPLLADDGQALHTVSQRVAQFSALLPTRVRTHQGHFDDNF
jgi:transcriptional regulator with XRE-family HTH domain